MSGRAQQPVGPNSKIFHCVANTIGEAPDGKQTSSGASFIREPNGIPPTEAGFHREEMITAVLDLSRADRSYVRDSLQHPPFLAKHWRSMVREEERRPGSTSAWAARTSITGRASMPGNCPFRSVVIRRYSLRMLGVATMRHLPPRTFSNARPGSPPKKMPDIRTFVSTTRFTPGSAPCGLPHERGRDEARRPRLPTASRTNRHNFHVPISPNVRLWVRRASDDRHQPLVGHPSGIREDRSM